MAIPTYSFILVGGRKTGKNSVQDRFISDVFYNDNRRPVIKPESRRLNHNGSLVEISLSVPLVPLLAFKKNSYILFYDITSRDSFDKAVWWISLFASDQLHFLVALVGTKKDLDAAREVAFDEGHRLANNNNLVFLETSAKENYMIEDLFHVLLNNYD
jgi:GTPase SAR1 family protein